MLVWLHPHVANLSCQECCTKLYDITTGKPKTQRVGPKREEQFFEGPRFAPACKHGVKCPKESPEKAKDHEPSWRNLLCMRAWRRHKSGAVLGTIDGLAADNFALLDELHHVIAQETLAKRLGASLIKAWR